MENLEDLRNAAADFGSEHLLTGPHGEVFDLATGYIPLLSTFTSEDKAAKGLRKRAVEDQPEPLVFFSGLELVRDNKVLLLSGPSGGGKSTFAKQLCFRLATGGLQMSTLVVRNEAGYVHPEVWNSAGLVPCYFAINNAQTLKSLVKYTIPHILARASDHMSPELVIVLDAVENAEIEAATSISAIATLILSIGDKNHRLLILAETRASRSFILPAAVMRYDILPLLETQRRQKVGQLTQIEPHLVKTAVGLAAANPALFALAFQAGDVGNKPEELVDVWLSKVVANHAYAEALDRQAFQQICDDLNIFAKGRAVSDDAYADAPYLISTNRVRQLLAARHLSTLPHEAAVNFFCHDPVATADVIQSLLVRTTSFAKFDILAEALLQGHGTVAQRAATLLARSAHACEQLDKQISQRLLAVLGEGFLPFNERNEAGRLLAHLGDPRDLMKLTRVPAGTSMLGSNTHPNSQPPHEVVIDSFQIGIYPITVRDYNEFVCDTGRPWASPDRQDLYRQNVPSTDVTWLDAVAYCRWLTTRWRKTGRISLNERVRLPTEPEWERAASGGRASHEIDEYIFPWGAEWRNDASNSEETGLNETCSVGLFPKGQSLYGCHDMAGNIWEWCTTLWGEDMASPSFQYPWQNDEREAEDDREAMRRVLRGGCFSSGRPKVTCTYRGSLEPVGYWRGNGFRVVIAKDHD